MWNMLTHLLAFTGGALSGIVTMCLMQAAGREDKWIKDMERGENE